MKMLEQEQLEQIFGAVNPLDRRNGRVPSWIEVSTKAGLEDYPRGKKKLFQSFYRAHSMLARGKEKKGRRLLRHLENCREFQELEEQHPSRLNKIVEVVNKRAG